MESLPTQQLHQNYTNYYASVIPGVFFVNGGMSFSLSTALGIDKDGTLGRFFSVKEQHGSNANFVLTSLMLDGLKKESGICLITLHNTFGHYHNVLTKLGNYNLKELRESNDLETVEILKELEENMNRETGLCDFLDKEKPFAMKDLFATMKNKVCTLLTKKTSVYVVIDDVSHFLDLGVALKDVVSFLQYCQTLLTTFSGITLVVLCHVWDVDDNLSSLLSNYLSHVSDTCVVVSALQTGHSSDVSGVLEVINRTTREMVSQQWNKQNVYHFKLSDRHVRLCAPGMSMFQV